MKKYYTDKEYKQLCKDMVILCDTRENENSHIVEWFDSKKINHISRALSFGDYGFMIKANEDNGFTKDTMFVDELWIERKNSLNELASSIQEGRFHNEVKGALNIKHKFLLVEDGSWEGILKHYYRNQYSEVAFFRTLITLMTKYGITILFCKKENAPMMIYNICLSVLEREIIK